MSYVIAAPELVAAAATDLASVASTISSANAAASAGTRTLLAAGADEISVAIAALFDTHAQAYQAVSARAAAFHAQFVQALNTGAVPTPAPKPPTSARSCSTRSMRPPGCWWAGR